MKSFLFDPKLILVPAFALSLMACGSEPPADTGSDAGVSTPVDTACADGETQRCDCPEGERAASVCAGGVWSECVCAPIQNLPDATSDTSDVDPTLDADAESDADDVGDTEVLDAEPVDTRPEDADAGDPKPDTEPTLTDTLDDVDAEIDTLPDVIDAETPDVDVLDTDTPDTPDASPHDAADAPDGVLVDVRPDVIADVVDVLDTSTPDVGSDTVVTDVGPDVPPDPCLSIPAGGRCIDDGAYEVCIVFSGSGRRIVRQENCDDDELCSAASGTATCVPNYICRDDQSRCAGPGTLEVCDSDVWIPTPCPEGCEVIIGGAACTEPVVETTTLAGALYYEAYRLADDRSDWADETVFYAAPSVLAVLYDGDEQFDYTLTGAFDSEAPGSFELNVPEVEDGDEVIYFFAISYDDEGEIRTAIASPNAGVTGEIDVQAFLGGTSRGSAFYWQWGIGLDTARELVDLGISIDGGAGALALFDSLIRTNALLSAAVAEPVPNLLIWYPPSATFSCGACAVDYPAQLAGTEFANQVMIGGGSDFGAFAEPVTVHEIGHVVMSHYGTSPEEGGTHYLGVPQHPGLAWSEGWATGFSSLARESSLYFSKQSGGMFWFDINSREYGFDVPWRRPVAANGLFQRVDENEVAAMVYALGRITGFNSLVQTLGAPRINNPPYARGYTTRYWDELNEAGEPLPYTDTRRPAPMFADFADALVCNGEISAAAINGVTRPTVNYPYNGSSPNCAVSPHVRSPLTAEMDRAVMEQNGNLVVEITLTRHVPGIDVAWSVDLPAGASLLRASESPTIAGADTTDEKRMVFEFSTTGTNSGDLTLHFNAGDQVSWGWHTPIVWRFGRPDPSPGPLQIGNGPITLWGVPMGHPVVNPMVPVR